MKQNSRLAAILDKNLYGRSFFSMSVPYLLCGLVIQFFLHWFILTYLLIVYLPVYLSLVIVSGFATKNVRSREFHQMGWWFAFLLLIVSAFSKAFAVTYNFGTTTIGILQFFLVLTLSEGAFVVSIIMIVVYGQRASLRKSIGLNDDFFEKEKRTWKNQLDGFPNLDRILENLDGGRFIASLFDKGFFNLVVLWSCNVMEEVVDATAKGVISKCPEKRQLFKTETGHGLPYPTQLKNLGYRSYQSNEEFNIDRLWNRLRNKIAHHNYRPSFDETNKALQVMVSFVKEMPTVLQDWKSQF